MATQDYTNGVTLTDAGEFERFDCAAYSVLSGVGGTANAITATGPATYTLDATRPPVWFVAASTNTGATTIAITPSGGSALTAKNIFVNGTALVGGELRAGIPVGIVYDGTQFNVIGYVSNPTLGAEQASTSGTSIDFTSIPSWVKKITIQLSGVSTNGTSPLMVQLGDSGGVEAAGYSGAIIVHLAGPSISVATHSTYFSITGTAVAAATYDGKVEITQFNSSNKWTLASQITRTDGGSAASFTSDGSKSTSATLDRVRISTQGGTDTFDAGAINIVYE